MRLGGIYISVGAKTDKLKRDLKKAETMTEKTGIRMRHHFSSINFARLGLAAVAFGAAAAYGMKKAIDAASDLEETTSKFSVVFAGQAELAEKNAKILGDSFAMSREEAMRYLSSVQDLLVPMGVAAGQAAKLSNEVVKLAADLGSFNNMPTERVMLDIQSALVGNFETMKKYGVVLKETVVSQKALEMGLAATKQELTAGDKAQAAYVLMMEGSKAAIGDMERTSESYANQIKKLNANLSDLTAEIGKELLPFATEIVKRMNQWIEANGEFVKTNVVGFIQGVGIALEVLLEPLRLVVELWRTLPELMGKMPALPPPPNMAWSQADPSGVVGAPGVPSQGVLDEGKARLEAFNQDTHDMIIASLEGQWEAQEEHANRLMLAEQARVEVIRNAENEIVSLRQRSADLQSNLHGALFTSLLQIAGVSGKKLFVLQKAWAVGSAIVSAYQAANLALATIPPPAGEAVAAARLKYGLMNAALIGATAVGQMAASSSGSVGGGTYTSPTVTTTDAFEAGESRGSINFYIQGHVIGDEAFIDDMVEKINAAEDRDVFINQSNYAVEVL